MVTGKPEHSSQIFQPDVGAGAVFEAARILNSFREELADYGDLTFNPGIIVGGTTAAYDEQTSAGSAFGKNNVIAKIVEISGDLRALTAAELKHAKDRMQEIVSNNLPHTSATLTIGEGYPPLAPLAGNLALLRAYSEVSEDLGYGPVAAVNPRNAGAADISFTAGYVNRALDGLGLMGSGGHTRDEIADMSSLEKNTAKAAILIFRLAEQYKQDR
jgi:glutamate carboxypeptidase